jgi:hypothetical protein
MLNTYPKRKARRPRCLKIKDAKFFFILILHLSWLLYATMISRIASGRRASEFSLGGKVKSDSRIGEK